MGDVHHNVSNSETQRWFTTTHWTVIFMARDGDCSKSDAALEQLCQSYRSPIYAYLRRQGHAPADAEDLTHDFFAHLLSHEFLNHLQNRDGKFRSFLLTFLKHFLSDVRDKARALKRGGNMAHVSLDSLEADVRDMIEPADGATPDQVYQRKWAQTVMERSWSCLRASYQADGNVELFDQLNSLQPGGDSEATYAEVGAKFGMAEGTIKSAMHRLRRRHREILRNEIAQTVSRPEEVDEEIQNLLMLLGR